MAGTTWNVFTPGTKLKASDINENFDWIEGSIVPNNAGAAAHNTYDMGSYVHLWGVAYFGTSLVLGGQTISSPVNTNNLSGGVWKIKTGGVRGTTANSGGTQQEIAQGTISEADLRNNAATTIPGDTDFQTIAGSTTSNIASVTIPATGQPILIMGQASIHLAANTAGAYTVVVALLRGTTILTGTASFQQQNDSTSLGTNTVCFSVQTFDNPGAGSFTYNIAYTVAGGSFTSAPFHNLIALEFKK